MENIVKINASDYGLQENKANELIGNLPQIIKERSEFEKQYDNVINLNIEDIETTIKARELRLLIQKNRTQGINVWHKTTKDFFLRGGQFVDAIKRKEIAINERMENGLSEIEKYAEIKEQKRLSELQQLRVEELSKYIEDASERDLSGMDEDVWIAYLSTKKKEYEDKIAAEKAAELERLKQEETERLFRKRSDILYPVYSYLPDNYDISKIGELSEKDFNTLLHESKDRKVIHEKEQAKIKAENERLIKEAEQKEKKRLEEESERLRLAKIQADKLEKERKERELEAEKQRKIQQQKIDNEKAKADKLAAELKAKEDEERKAKEEEEKRIQAELSKGDSAKVQDLINDLAALKTKYTFKSAKNKKMYEDTCELIDKVINHINK